MTTGQVYFVECAGRIKIGFSSDVPGRLKTLSTAAPASLELLATVAGTVCFERAIHKAAHAYRVRGEWFRDCEEVRAIMVSIVEHGGSAVGFVEGPPPAARSASPVQMAITNIIKAKRPYGAKAWEFVAAIFGLKERAAKHRLANASSYTIEEVQALIRGDDGHEFLKAVMADAKPEWWEPLRGRRPPRNPDRVGPV